MDHCKEPLRYCPIHEVIDSCYDDAMETKWQALKARVPDPENWTFHDDSRQIIHKTGGMGVAVNVEFWWRAMKYV